MDTVPSIDAQSMPVLIFTRLLLYHSDPSSAYWQDGMNSWVAERSLGPGVNTVVVLVVFRAFSMHVLFNTTVLHDGGAWVRAGRCVRGIRVRRCERGRGREHLGVGVGKSNPCMISCVYASGQKVAIPIAERSCSNDRKKMSDQGAIRHQPGTNLHRARPVHK
jgi:hypothetical protein